MESGLPKLFLCILSARDTSLLFFVFRPISLISLRQGKKFLPMTDLG